MKTTAMILAGGKSSRFGRDKSLLILNGQRIVEYLVEQCYQFADEVLIVSNSDAKFRIPGVRELSDIYPEKGPLGGIHAGLTHAKGDTVFVTACDMPMFDLELARELVALSSEYEAALPVADGRLQPLFAMLRRAPALRAAERMLYSDHRKLRFLYDRLKTCYLCRPVQEEPKDLFFNINYPADFERLVSGERGR